MLSCIGGNCSSFILNFVSGRCVWKITQIGVFLDDHTEQSARRKVQYGAGKSVCSKSNMSLWFANGTEVWIFTLTLAVKLPPMLRKSLDLLSLHLSFFLSVFVAIMTQLTRMLFLLKFSYYQRCFSNLTNPLLVNVRSAIVLLSRLNGLLWLSVFLAWQNHWFWEGEQDSALPCALCRRFSVATPG